MERASPRPVRRVLDLGVGVCEQEALRGSRESKSRSHVASTCAAPAAAAVGCRALRIVPEHIVPLDIRFLSMFGTMANWELL